MNNMYKFYVYKGNFSFVVKNLLKERGCWEEVEEEGKALVSTHFIWKPESLFDFVGQLMTSNSRSCRSGSRRKATAARSTTS